MDTGGFIGQRHRITVPRPIAGVLTLADRRQVTRVGWSGGTGVARGWAGGRTRPPPIRQRLHQHCPRAIDRHLLQRLRRTRRQGRKDGKIHTRRKEKNDRQLVVARIQQGGGGYELCACVQLKQNQRVKGRMKEIRQKKTAVDGVNESALV